MIADHYIEEIEQDAWQAMNLFEDCILPRGKSYELWALLSSIHDIAREAQKHSESAGEERY